MSSSQIEKMSSADFFTSTHRISGKLETKTKPFLDFVNDRSQSFLLAFNVYVSRLDQPGHIGAHAPSAYIAKDNLSFVIVPSREIRAPDQARFSSQTYDALVTLAGVEVRGKFAGPHKFDLRTFSPSALEPFIVLTEASACLIALPDVEFSGESILINRARLESFCLGD
jgi:hypothetical protein